MEYARKPYTVQAYYVKNEESFDEVIKWGALNGLWVNRGPRYQNINPIDPMDGSTSSSYQLTPHLKLFTPLGIVDVKCGLWIVLDDRIQILTEEEFQAKYEKKTEKSENV